MLAVGHHDYYYFNHFGTVLCLTIGDCENRAARQFLNSVPEHMFQQLATAIGNRIWGPNMYNVQNEAYMNYLSGQQMTQQFMELLAPETTFFALMPLDRVCLSFVTFMPFHDIRSRWEIELDFGHTNDFHTNTNPYQPQLQNENQPQDL